MFLSCGVCFLPVDVALLCGHSFCFNCIYEIGRRNSLRLFLECPTCKKATDLRDGQPESRDNSPLPNLENWWGFEVEGYVEIKCQACRSLSSECRRKFWVQGVRLFGGEKLVFQTKRGLHKKLGLSVRESPTPYFLGELV